MAECNCKKPNYRPQVVTRVYKLNSGTATNVRKNNNFSSILDNKYARAINLKNVNVLHSAFKCRVAVKKQVA